MEVLGREAKSPPQSFASSLDGLNSKVRYSVFPLSWPQRPLLLGFALLFSLSLGSPARAVLGTEDEPTTLVGTPAGVERSPGSLEAIRASLAQDPSESRDPREDRRWILFLAEHARLIDAEILRASQHAAAIVRDAEAIQAALEAQRRMHEEAQRRANARQLRNGVALLLGAEEEDIEFMNTMDDLSDALRGLRDAQARADIPRRVYLPEVVSVFGGELSISDRNSIRSFDNFYVAVREGRRARQLSERVEIAKGDVAAAKAESRRIAVHIQGLESDRAQCLDALQEFSDAYRARVQALVAEIPGFTSTLGEVQDIAFDLKLPFASPRPLIHSLTFQLALPDRELGQVDVPVDLLGEMLEDEFEALIRQRQDRLGRAQARVDELEAGKTSRLQALGRIERDLRREQEALGRTSGFKIFTRSRIQGAIRSLEGERRELIRQSGEGDEAQAAARADRVRAEGLLRRAQFAQERLRALQEAVGKDTLYRAYQSLRSLL